MGFSCYGAYDDEREDDFGADLDYTDWLARKIYPRAGQLFATLRLPNLAIFRLRFCILTEESLVGFIRRHAATLKEIRVSCVALDSKSKESTSWEKAFKKIAPILSLDLVELEWLQGDDIGDLHLAKDPANTARYKAYCKCLAEFLYHRGQTECPKIADFYPGT